MIILVLFSLRKPECSLDAENVQWRRGGDEITLSSIYIFLVLVRVRVSCAHLLSDDVCELSLCFINRLYPSYGARDCKAVRILIVACLLGVNLWGLASG